MKQSLIGYIVDLRYRKISHTATVNDLLKEFFRKVIHLCASLVPLFAAWNLKLTIYALASVLLLYTLCELGRLSGHRIPFVSRITSYAARRRDAGRFVLGPVTMAVGVLVTLLVFPPEPARVGIFALAFGDGIASLAGKLFGKNPIPYTNGKTVEGSTACFIAVFISTLAVSFNPLVAVSVALFAAIIEMLPLRDYDNLLIPLVIAGFYFLLP